MFAITKSFKFEAAHSLPHLPEGHKCRNVHGHSYVVTVEVASEELDQDGFVVDYAEISAAVKPVIARLDHQNLNDLMSCRTTAENIAAWLFHEIPVRLRSVTVKETQNTSATYYE